MEAHCARIIQRAFRGFQGRALWRRLHLRILEEKRQRTDTSLVCILKLNYFILNVKFLDSFKK